METPLLNGEDYAPVKSFAEVKWMIWSESVKMWKIAGPICFQLICQYGTSAATSIFVGHIGDVELSAVSIALNVFGIFAYGFMLGMGSALETLCGQAYGAGQVHLLGIYMQRSFIILFVSALFLTPVYIFATPILKLLGQEDDIAELAGVITIQILPQLFALVVAFPTQKFLQAQSKVGLIAWVSFVAVFFHVGILWLFIYGFGWGTTGAAVAFVITSWATALGNLVYVVGWCKDGWNGLSWLAFTDIWPFVRLSLASAVMLCLEIWYPMSIIILTGHLDNASIAVGSLSICMNINGWVAMIFVAINAAISVRVSNELGAGHPRAAKYSVYATVIQSLFIGLVFMVVIWLFRDYIALIYSSTTEMIEAVSKLAFLLGVTMVLNSVQQAVSGVAIGGGWQALVAYINLGCYYILGLPLGFLLGYTADLGVKGIWDGMISGIGLQTLMLLFVLYKINWNNEVEQTTERMLKWGGINMNNETI